MSDRILTLMNYEKDLTVSHDHGSDIAQVYRLIRNLRNTGIVITVDLVPHTPLRMGAYDTMIEVRKARVLDEPFDYCSKCKHAVKNYRECPICNSVQHHPV